MTPGYDFPLRKAGLGVGPEHYWIGPGGRHTAKADGHPCASAWKHMHSTPLGPREGLSRLAPPDVGVCQAPAQRSLFLFWVLALQCTSVPRTYSLAAVELDCVTAARAIVLLQQRPAGQART